MAYNIFRDAKVVNSYVSELSMNKGYRCIWDTDRDDKGWDVGGSFVAKGTWAGMLFGTMTSGNSYMTRTGGFHYVDTAVADIIYIRMKVDLPPITGNRVDADTGKIYWRQAGDTIFSEERSVTFDVEADGEWHVYEVRVIDSQYWVGYIDNLRIHPLINGISGTEVFFSYIEITSSSTYFNIESLGDDEYSGSRGYIMGIPSGPAYTIEEGVNDSLIVNIDDYGNVPISLSPGTNLSGNEVAKDLEARLARIDIGGYSEVRVDYDDLRRFIIYSGIRDYDSNVDIIWGSGSAAYLLGFTDSLGNSVATKEYGEPPSSLYIPYAAYRLRTMDIIRLFDGNTDQDAVVIDPGRYLCEAGRADYAYITKGRSKDFRGSTIIDIDHSVTGTGRLKKFRMQGVPGTNAKLKIFRPRMDGTITLIYEQSLGVQSPSTTYTTMFDNFVENIDVDVRRGDLIGIYDCILYVGNVQTSDRNPDATYYMISGDATGTFDPGSIYGNGTMGLSIYAHSEERQNMCMLDIDLSKRYLIESIDTVGNHNDTEIYYNLLSSTEIGSGINVSADYYGYRHLHRIESIGTGQFSNVCHPNTTYNLHALTDGKLWAENGVSSFQVNDLDATYFYLAGEAEWDYGYGSGYEFEASAVFYYGINEDYNSHPYSILFDFTGLGVTKNISRVVLYFKDQSASFSYWWSYYVGDGRSGGNDVPITRVSYSTGCNQDGSLIDYDEVNRYRLVPSYNEVYTDDILNYVDVLYDNPTYGGLRYGYTDDQGVFYPDQAYDYYKYIQMSSLKFNKIDWRFDEIETDKLKYTCNYHNSTKITEAEIYASTNISSTPYGSILMYFSSDGEDFARTVDREVGGDSVNSYVGFNPRFLRMIIFPFVRMTLKDISATLQSGAFRFGSDEQLEQLIPDDTPRGKTGAIKTLPIKNNTEDTLNLTVDIGDEHGASGVVYYNSMASIDDLESPVIGTPPIDYHLEDDRDMVIEAGEVNINLNGQCWGLNNLVTGKNWYYCDYYDPNTTNPSTFFWSVGGVASNNGYIGIKNTNSYGLSFKFVAIDLGDVYDLDPDLFFDVYSAAGRDVWPDSVGRLSFSVSDVDNVNAVSWGNSDYQRARWVRIYDAANDDRYLDNVRVYPDITKDNKQNYWTDLGTTLSDFKTTTYVNSTVYPVVANRLYRQYYIGSISLDRVSTYDDNYWALGGGSNVSYQNSYSTHPGNFQWNGFGTDPGYISWIAARNINRGKKLANVGAYLSIDMSLFSFAQVFEYESHYNVDVSTLSNEDTLYSGTLYDSSGDNEVYPSRHAFVSDTELLWESSNDAPAYIWRMFGTVPDGQTLVRQKKSIKEFSLTVPLTRSSIIDEFKIQKLIDDADPTDNFSWEDVEVYIGQASEFGFDDVCDFSTEYCDETSSTDRQNLHEQFLNEDTNLYSGYDYEEYKTIHYVLSEPIPTQGIRFYVNSTFDNTKDDTEEAHYVRLSSLILYENADSGSSVSVGIEEDFLNTNGDSVSSLKITYPASEDDIVTVVSSRLNVGKDIKAAERDFISIDMYVDDINNIDTSYGFLYFGNNYNDRYLWNISDELSIFTSGWNNIKVRFIDAQDKSIPTLEEADYEPSLLNPSVNINNRDCRYFAVSLKGNSASSQVVMNFDNLKIKRNNFDDFMMFDYGLYLVNKEYLVLPISDISMSRGAIGFFIKPDYNQAGEKYPLVHNSAAYFTLTDVDNNIISFLTKGATGQRFYVKDVGGSKIFQATSDDIEFYKSDLVHLAVAWDSTGEKLDDRGSTVIIFKDGVISYRSNTRWSATTNRGLTLFVGGTLPLMSMYGITEVPTGSIVVADDDINSITGIISDFTVYNYPKNDFSDYLDRFEVSDMDLLTPAKMIEISSDGTNFYRVGDDNLPLRVNSVAADATANIYVRTILPKILTGSEGRTAGLVVQWEKSL